MGFSNIKNFYFLFLAIIIFLISLILFLVNKYQYVMHTVSTKDFTYNTASVSGAAGAVNSQVSPVVEPRGKPLEQPPSILKAVYVTGWSAGSKNYNNYLTTLLKTTQINSVVVDVKDY